MPRERAVDLCLACSSSLPPSRPSGSKASIYLTQCCDKPICPACISANPRLARYNPCIRCLGGVGIVTARSSLKPGTGAPAKSQNLDGGIHDDEVFTLGDDEEDQDESEPLEDGEKTPSTPPPAYTELEETPSDTLKQPGHDAHDTPGLEAAETAAPEVSNAIGVSTEYHIQPKDTLVGIALRLGVDGRLLCRLNNLPPSTLRTTPHLLHTRTVLKLPPFARNPGQPAASSPADPEREARRAREKAVKRFQTVTKETDWRIAKAYVAIAEDVEQESIGKELPKKSRIQDNSTAEGRAMDQYLDDEEWEARELQQGRGVQIPKFPLASQSTNAQKGKKSAFRW